MFPCGAVLLSARRAAKPSGIPPSKSAGSLVGANCFLGRRLGHFIFSLIGFKRAIFRNIFQGVLGAILDFLFTLFLSFWTLGGLGDQAAGRWDMAFQNKQRVDRPFLNPKPQTLNPKPQTRNPKPETLNPKP